jgi:hypothetical protein
MGRSKRVYQPTCAIDMLMLPCITPEPSTPDAENAHWFIRSDDVNYMSV